ncbi:MAG: hypothetical protein ACHQO8_03835 [Vicinamibacterales bacterium]
MSERTAPALAKLAELLPLIKDLPPAGRDQLVGEMEALQRAIGAFHMEAIRFRMYSVDRLIKSAGDQTTLRQTFEELRQALEAAGFHTRSHA